VTGNRMSWWAYAAFAVYVAAIVASNWMIGHVGIPTVPGGNTTCQAEASPA